MKPKTCCSLMNKLFNHHFVLKFIGRRSCGHLNTFKKSKFNVESFSDFPVNSGKFDKPFSTCPIPPCQGQKLNSNPGPWVDEASVNHCATTANQP